MSPHQRIMELVVSPMSSVTLQSSFDRRRRNQERRRLQLPRTNWRQLQPKLLSLLNTKYHTTSHRPRLTNKDGSRYQLCQRGTLASIAFPNNCLPWYYKQRLLFQINQVRRRLQYILNDIHLKRNDMILPSSIPPEHRGSFRVNNDVVVRTVPSPKSGPSTPTKTMTGNQPNLSSSNTDLDRHHHRRRRSRLHDSMPASFREPSQKLFSSTSNSSSSSKDMNNNDDNSNNNKNNNNNQDEEQKENPKQNTPPARGNNLRRSNRRNLLPFIPIGGRSKAFMAMKSSINNNKNNNINKNDDEEQKENLSQSTIAAGNKKIVNVGGNKNSNRKNRTLRDVTIGRRTKNNRTVHSGKQQQQQQNRHHQQQQRKDWYIRQAGMVTRSAYCSMEMISFDKKRECFHRTEIAYPFQPCIKSRSNDDDDGGPQRRLARTLRIQTAAVNNVYKHSLIWQ